MKDITFPSSTEYAEFYASYIAYLKDLSLFETLISQKEIWKKDILPLTDEQANYSYDKGKWTVKEILQHIIDSERVFVYRAMCIVRNDKSSLPGFDENDYVTHSHANKKTITELVRSYNALRSSTILFFEQVDQEACAILGNANGSPISARAIAYIIAGHERHHLTVLKDRYQLNLSL